MAGVSDNSALGIAPLDRSTLPADVRAGGKPAEKLYASALAFENLLLQQLGTSMFDSTQDSSAGDPVSGGSSDAGGYGQLLPGAFADSLTAGGGLGLADQLFRSLSGGAGA